MLSAIALFLLIFVAVVLFYTVIAIHDIPYEIAKRRNHPQQDAIQVAGWVSLLTLHVIWPFLWIWATLYREDRNDTRQSSAPGNGDSPESGPETLQALQKELAAQGQRIQTLELQLARRG